jgi:predicted SAM-dependent methyltransferase
MQLFRSCLTLLRRQRLLKKIRQAGSIRLNLGAGGTNYEGWISTEKELLDITKRSDFERYFNQKKISKILAEHVVEHIPVDEFICFLRFVKDYLEPMASIRIAVPDAYHPSEYVRELTMPGGFEQGANDHKYFYTIDQMSDIASLVSYKLEPIEYFDSKGYFHSHIRGWDNGYISRSSSEYTGRFTLSNDEYMKMYSSIPPDLRGQFITNNISYTSLIVDFYNA